jgi:hypothetical protein
MEKAIRITATIAVLFVATATAAANQYEFISDDFSGGFGQWDDLSTAVSWGGNGSPTSALTLSEGGVTMDPAAQPYSSFYANDLKMFQNLDFQFPFPVDRTHGQTLSVDFTAKWDSRSLSNEGSRLVVYWNHDYPDGGLDLDFNDKYDDTDQEWWARPAYNMRIRTETDESMLMYGGGPDVEGEFEYNSGLGWWFPGFASAPGGGSPQPSVTGVVGAGANRYSQTEFRKYRYEITPTEQRLWYDVDGNGTLETDEIVGTQDITGDLDSQGVRKNFHELEGLRIFWRGSNNRAQAIVDDVVIKATDLVSGDANMDGAVDVGDLGILAGNWNQGSDNTWIQADFSGDGLVDVSDLGILAGNWQGGAGVPEPASLALLSITAAAGLLRRRR